MFFCVSVCEHSACRAELDMSPALSSYAAPLTLIPLAALFASYPPVSSVWCQSVVTGAEQRIKSDKAKRWPEWHGSEPSLPTTLPITLWGSSQSVGRPEWGLYFELIAGIYAVIRGSVVSSKQLDAQTGYDTACSAGENCCLEKKAESGKCREITFFSISQARDSRETWCLITDDFILNFTDPEQDPVRSSSRAPREAQNKGFGALDLITCAFELVIRAPDWTICAVKLGQQLVFSLIICAKGINKFQTSIWCPFPSHSPPKIRHSLMRNIQELYIHKYHKCSAAYYCI